MHLATLRTITLRWASCRTLRRVTILGLDALATGSSLCLALLLRLGGYVPEQFAPAVRLALPLLISVRLGAILSARLDGWSFRMSGLSEGVRLGVANVVGTAGFIVLHVALSAQPLPRTVYALEFFATTTLMGIMRFAPRLAHTSSVDRRRRARAGAVRTLVVGAGSAGDLLVRDVLRSGDSNYTILGFVDDDPAKQGTRLQGRPVLGRLRDLPRLIAEQRAATVLLAIPSLPSARVREILSTCATSKVSFKVIPASFAFLDQKISAAMLHDLSPEDLLPRDSIAFDPEEIRGLVEGRRALVTGAAGSIGSEICRQLAASGVAQLVMVDMNENELYLNARRLEEAHPGLDLRPEVADVREPSRLLRLAGRYRPHDVFHAAAHKHVPLMEHAPEEAVKNNVFGTLNVARMADACGAERLVVISTDKAVKPTSVMGATKRIAELVTRDLARASRTRMTAVRFGNVLGSAGSVVPIFKSQIERGGPVTVTHPDCTRYFMTIPEAVGLVLVAGLGGYGELCVLQMGEPIRIADLAANLITMAGRVPGQDIPVVFTGLRPGEKLFEELLTEDEEDTREARNRILVAKSPPPPPDLHERLRELRLLAEDGDREALLRGIERLVPTYRRTPNRKLELAPEPPLARTPHRAPAHAVALRAASGGA